MLTVFISAYFYLAQLYGGNQGNTSLVNPWNFQILSTHTISLEDRQPDKWVNSVFVDNMLLNLAYMEGKVSSSGDINWDSIRRSSRFSIPLAPGETYSFHQDVLPEYQGAVMKISPALFNSQQGFKSDGYLVGDGVCHLASLMNWVAKDAGLRVVAPTNHNFAPIPEIPREYGVAIYDVPGQITSNERQNLYITNNKSQEISLNFDYSSDNLTFSITQ